MQLPRKPRIHFSGALYHVVARGNNKAHIFENDVDKQLYLDIIKRYHRKFHFRIYAYCIMNNHAHLLIEVSDIELSKIMQAIQQVFTQVYNKKYERTGHVFEQRYKAFLCDKDNYLLQLIRYIHQNPVKAKISQSLSYRWSSHNEYVGQPNLVNVESILSFFSGNKGAAINSYLQFMGCPEQEDITTFKLDELTCPVKHETKLPSEKMDEEMFWKNVLAFYSMGTSIVRNVRISKDERRKRTIIILLAKELTNLTNAEIGRKFGLTPSAITKILIRADVDDLKDEYETLKLSICQA